MKRPVEIVQDIIAASDFPHDEIFLDSIPKEKEDSINETQVLLTESDNGPSDYGNSDFISLMYGVYIQIFYALRYTLTNVIKMCCCSTNHTSNNDNPVQFWLSFRYFIRSIN